MCLTKIIYFLDQKYMDFFTYNRRTNHESPCPFIHPSLTYYSLRIFSNKSLDQTDTLSAAVRDEEKRNVVITLVTFVIKDTTGK